MLKHETFLQGLFILESPVFKDDRGDFLKVYSKEIFLDYGINECFQELYFSVSHKNVIRGMHFQTPPFDHSKIVFVSKGAILDVVLDIRKNSPTFGRYFSVELDDISGKFLFIPCGCAHGFKSLEDNSIVNYFQTTCYSKEHDFGILYNSFGFKWDVKNPIISERDKNFVKFEDYKSVF